MCINVYKIECKACKSIQNSCQGFQKYAQVFVSKLKYSRTGKVTKKYLECIRKERNGKVQQNYYENTLIISGKYW